jgi:hypothetical protein
MGGHIFATALLQLGRERGVITILPEDTYLDEVIGRETPLFAMPFIHKMHLLAKTGSGQT